LIGCKVWINRGEILKKGLRQQINPSKPEPRKPRNFTNKKPYNKDSNNKFNNYNRRNTADGSITSMVTSKEGE
jgi:ribosomal protein S3